MTDQIVAEYPTLPPKDVEQWLKFEANAAAA